MKFNFKIQQYQTDAVDAVVKVFNGQGFHDKISYIRDLGKMKSKDMQMTLGFTDEEMQLYDPTNDTGYKNGNDTDAEHITHTTSNCLDPFKKSTASDTKSNDTGCKYSDKKDYRNINSHKCRN